MVAFSPGAQDTMMVLALALHLDPVYVGAHHVARFLVVTIHGGDRRTADGERNETVKAYSAASARCLNGRPSFCQTSTSASARSSIKPSS